MKSKLYSVLVLALAAVAYLYLVRESRQAQAARAEQAARADQRRRLHADLRRAQTALASLQARETGLKGRLHAATAGAADAPVFTLAQARAKTLRSWYALGNARLYQQLGLAGPITRQLENLQAAHWARLEDIDAAAKAQGLAPDDPTLKTLRMEETAQFLQAETALLGPTDAQAAQEYDRLTSGRMVADAVAGNVFDTATPLTASQANALAQIVANNSPSYQSGGPALTRDMDFQGVLQQAQQVLTPTQVGALQNYLMGISAARSVGMMTNPDFAFPPVN